ncbi:hypothetical protein L3Q82_003717 [Scortum barcoo]|uniref:Uncharacterized protein n=1 Tax=Scortum barcoo TaxID=214431 RepID=A0ACB8X7Z9_9TELE|nr:hypothetical protein L3Q82_003717 [Scortum barcoo]
MKEKEESMLASQILEAARRLMERRRLEIYLKECDVTMETSNMPYSVQYSEYRHSTMGVGSMEQVEDGILHTNTWLVGKLQAILGVLAPGV